MKIAGQNFNFVDTLNSPITVPDCFVMRASKIGGGNGEAKLYIASKAVMYPFFGNEGFVAKCFLLKKRPPFLYECASCGIPAPFARLSWSC